MLKVAELDLCCLYYIFQIGLHDRSIYMQTDRETFEAPRPSSSYHYLTVIGTA